MSGSFPCSAHVARYRSSCSRSASYGRSGGTTTPQPFLAARMYVLSDVPPVKTRNFRVGGGTIRASWTSKNFPAYENGSPPDSSAVKRISSDSS